MTATLDSAPLLLSIALLLVASSTTANAEAAGSNNATAELLFAEGKRLLSQGNHVEACRKFEESHRLELTIGARFQVAQCHERAGRTASAWTGYLEVAAMAKSRGQASREKAARDKAAELEPRLARLVIDVAGSTTPGLIIKRNGVLLARADWNTSLPVDPGHYTIEAFAPNRQPSTVSIDVVATDGGQKAAAAAAAAYEAHVPELGLLEEVQPAVLVNDDSTSRRHVLPEGAAARSETLRTVALIGGGTSLLAFGAGVLFTVSALNNKGASDPHCRGTMCDPTGAALRSDAVTAGDFATAMFVGGSALLAGSAALWMLAPVVVTSEEKSRASRRLDVAVGLGAVNVRATW